MNRDDAKVGEWRVEPLDGQWVVMRTVNGLDDEVCRCLLLADAEEIARDHNTTLRLPLTADGVRVVPLVTSIYHPDEIGADGPAALAIHSSNLGWASRGPSTGTPYYRVSECYASKAAAQAAAKEGRP